MTHEKPAGFEDFLSDYTAVLFDGNCGEPVAWGFRILRHLGEERFDALRKHGELECINSPGEWGLIVKNLTREAAASQYGEITEEVFGLRGGWKSSTFGTKKFISKRLRPAKMG